MLSSIRPSLQSSAGETPLPEGAFPCWRLPYSTIRKIHLTLGVGTLLACQHVLTRGGVAYGILAGIMVCLHALTEVRFRRVKVVLGGGFLHYDGFWTSRRIVLRRIRSISIKRAAGPRQWLQWSEIEQEDCRLTINPGYDDGRELVIDLIPFGGRDQRQVIIQAVKDAIAPQKRPVKQHASP